MVHTHCTKAGLLGRLAAWLARVPVIVHTVHGWRFALGAELRSLVYPSLKRAVARLTDRIISVGRVLQEEAAAWRMAPHAKLATIYSGIEIDFGAYVVSRAPGRR